MNEVCYTKKKMCRLIDAIAAMTGISNKQKKIPMISLVHCISCLPFWHEGHCIVTHVRRLLNILCRN